jgi:peptidoglycan hydrolase FlgJ
MNMSISPVSDLVMDVVQAADPAMVIDAQAKLKSIKAAHEAVELASTDKGFTATVRGLDNARDSKIASLKDTDKTPETYKNFEAMVLQNFVQSMMPNDSEEVYGKGNAGDYWKSMMSEQIAKSISEGGGIGIAASLMKHQAQKTADAADETFAAIGKTDTGITATRMVAEYQRKALDTLLPNDNQNPDDRQKTVL